MRPSLIEAEGDADMLLRDGRCGSSYGSRVAADASTAPHPFDPPAHPQFLWITLWVRRVRRSSQGVTRGTSLDCAKIELALEHVQQVVEVVGPHAKARVLLEQLRSRPDGLRVE